MESTKVRVGVIGGGTWGNYHLLAASQMAAEGLVELVAIADPHESSAVRRSQEYTIKPYLDYCQMIEQENLDAVTIATPDHMHREIVVYAVGKGLHVLIEKPLDLTTAGCRQMVDAAQARGVLLMVDFHKRYDVYNQDIMQKVHQGKLGTLQHIYAYMEDKITVPTQMLRAWAGETSPFWFIGVHKLDLVRWVTGLEPVSVLAKGCKGKLSAQGIDTYDSVSVFVEMEGGVTCTIEVNWIIPGHFEALVNQGLRIVGTEGMIEIDGQDRGLRYCVSDGGMSTPNLGAIHIQDSILGYKMVSGYYVDPIKDFLRNVSFLQSGGRIEQLSGRYPSGMDGMKATQVAEAVERSIKELRAVRISEIQ